jgi:hypothetical protein
VNPYRSTYQLDEATRSLGDSGFVGVDMLRDPAVLPPTLASKAINYRFENAVAIPRKGMVALPTRIGDWFPVVFPADTTQRIAFGIVNGAGTFGDTRDLQWVVLAAENRFYARGPCGLFKQLLYNGAVATLALAGVDIVFIQAAGRLVALCGEDLPVLVMDLVGTGFKSVTEATSDAGQGTGTLAIPNARWGIYFQGRLVVISGDLIYASDVYNLSRYALPSVWQLSKGSADKLTGIYQFNELTIVVSRERSLYALTNLVPDAAGDFTDAQFSVISTNLGIVAPQTVVQIGNRLLGLSQRGVVAIVQTDLNKLQVATDDAGNELLLSNPIRPLIERINFRYRAKCRATYYRGRYYLAVPLDAGEVVMPDLLANTAAAYTAGVWTTNQLMLGHRYRITFGANETGASNGTQTFDADDSLTVDFTATAEVLTINGSGTLALTATLQPLWQGVNNAVIVYNETTGAWEGYDTSRALTVRDWYIARYNGQDRLHFLSEQGLEYLYEEGSTDEVLYESLTPILEVRVSNSPPEGATLQVAGGTTITAKERQVNGAAAWGVPTLDFAIDNLQEGYTDALWTAAGVTKTAIAGGVRFTSQSTAVPALVVTGNWVATRRTWASGRGRDIWREPVASYLLTRGYSEGSPTRQVNAELALSLWDPCYTLRVVNEGASAAVTVIEDARMDRRKYDTVKDDYDLTNANDDFAASKRLDYSVNVNAATDITPLAGLQPDLEQQVTKRVPFTRKGRYAQIEVTGTQGRVGVRGVNLGVRDGERRMGTLV